MSVRRIAPVALIFIAFVSCTDNETADPVGAPSFSVTAGSKWYVSETGSSSGTGSISSPWSLEYALRGAKVNGVPRIVGGDTVLVRGGTYRGDLAVAPVGKYVVTVSGTPGARIVFREYQQEQAIIEDNTVGSNAVPDNTPGGKSQFNVSGSNLEFWGFEFRNVNAEPLRPTRRSNMVYNQGSNNRYEQLIIHDGGVGFYSEAFTSNVSIRGCIIYNVGYQKADRGHGHALYLRSNTGDVRATNNVMFNTFGYGIHAFTDPGEQLNGIFLGVNVAFNSGTLSTNSKAGNILLGGDDYANDDTVVSNFTYFTPGWGGTNVQVGWKNFPNGVVRMDGSNYFVGGDTVFHFGYWAYLSLEVITLVGSGRLIKMQDPAHPLPYSWYGGTYWGRSPTSSSWTHGSSNLTLDAWHQSTGLGAGDVANPGMPTTTKTVSSFYWANRDGSPPKGGFLIIYNWGQLSSVVVSSFCSMLPGGGTFKVHHVYDLNGPPIMTGSCPSASVPVPIVSRNAPQPYGVTKQLPATGTDFVVYRVSTP